MDLRGQRFGKLVVKTQAIEHRASKASRWLCACDCGGSKVIRSDSLRAGITRDCGCGKRAALSISSRTHGKSGHTIYTVWKNMIARCTRPSYIQYADYGGRGIKVCDRWRRFEDFYADMGDPPPRMSIDRIDNNGDYEAANCRWATRSMQALNSRKSLDAKLYDGQTVRKWADHYKISIKAVRSRISRFDSPHLPKRK